MVRILVVEDEKAISGLIEMNLKKAGYQRNHILFCHKVRGGGGGP